MLIMVFSVMLGWLPSNGRGETTLLFGVIPVSFTSIDGLRHLAMPATNLALFNLALLIRLTRAGAHEALLQDYVKFARAKGLTNARVIGVHVLRNILIPIVTVIGLQFGSLIGFAIVTESVFAWPGMGKLLIDSISVLDRPVIVAYLLVIVTVFIVINLIVDVLYSALTRPPSAGGGGGRTPIRVLRAREAPQSPRCGVSSATSSRIRSQCSALRCWASSCFLRFSHPCSRRRTPTTSRSST
jgi:ABC-type dipeptide/oligopeptide/nickel transport system permease component